MNELVWQRAAEDVLCHGWGTVRGLETDPVGRELHLLRQRALTQFWELMTEGVLSDVETQTGQYGLTLEADEGDLGLSEVRGHYVFNLGIPEEHPLATYRPWFYGGEVVLPKAATEFAAAASRLHQLLDYMTLRMFEELEIAAGLGFGELARSMVLGERLLRFQWYPAVNDGVPAEFEVTTPSRNVRIRGLQSGATRLVRASPHTDTGHWTWQVAATDDGVRFVDRADGSTVRIPGADSITGNVCDFLEVEQPQLQAPVHWVDFLDPQQPRASLSYFAHARPATQVRGELAGERLYRKLWEMGYAAPEDVESVQSLLSQRAAADAELVPRVIAVETHSEAWPAGFASGISRYYDPHGRPRRDPPGPLPPVPYDASS